MSALIYAGLVLALMVVVSAGIWGGVPWQGCERHASSGELVGGFGGVVVIAGLVAFATSYTTTFLSQSAESPKGRPAV
ncbi:MAG TPA: hypothetical protein H9755_12835 [Candidatus Dietzia intestinigallinarum]|nr:hypothetical protein [Candidatus Dietzia intestinigallinarum]